MKTIFLNTFLLCLFIGSVGCSSPTPSKEELPENLTGYWKIHQVKEKGGDIRDYKVSTTVDYIEVKPDLTGFRRKLKPKLDSTYEMTGNIEHFKINYATDSITFTYKTDLDEWNERLISSTKDEFTVKNNRGITYTYNRFESLKKELEAHEKEVQ